MTRHDRATRPAPWLLDGAAAVVSRLAHRYPHFFVQQANRDKSPANVRWLSMPSVRQSAADNLQEALRDGAWGYVEAIPSWIGKQAQEHQTHHGRVIRPCLCP
jgi:hypothetical protein